MFISLSETFQRKRDEMFESAKNTPLTSKITVNHSQQLDHFINHFQSKRHSEIYIAEMLDNQTLTVKLKGQLDINTSSNLTNYIDQNKHQWLNVEKLYIDILDLHFFDTSGIKSIVSFMEEMKTKSISISLITTKRAFEILDLMGVTEVFDDCNDKTFHTI
ncbi:anti-anti-sigma factor [Gracilibacillus ureilyticus]|uniref:Anti-anti-sigma factor n=1 Tax=Gracilibacillus ureilyticus TaxID=531814 RepID=A0A1H9UU08_9BACI|nr:STAS domain-containing protein [Gracilibacillus ureilyticus]SES12838.1 anti-anti-sigma factor [Gracilibacillus ureilyticus]